MTPPRSSLTEALLRVTIALGALLCCTPQGEPGREAAAPAARGVGSAESIGDAGGGPRPDSSPSPSDAGAESGAGGGELTVAVISDLNGAYGEASYGAPVHRAVRRLRELEPDLVLSTGDMIGGQREGVDLRAMWEGFHRAVTEPLAEAGIPLAVTPGNHDGSGYSRWRAEREEFRRQWESRRPAVKLLDGGAYPLRYSFEQGPALFVSLDATEVGPLEAEQRAWLAAQLEAGADRPVKVVFGHLPLSPVTRGREAEVLADRELERVMEEGGVDLYLSGHHHGYYPGRRGALRLVSTGCLGGGARPLLGTTEATPRSLLVLEIGEAGITSLEAYTGEGFAAPLDRSTLPPHLGSPPHRLTRDDLR